ncbi:cold shock domain-containing protein [Nocardia sp. NPDC005746]|uniref:cold-shock protein n=1 Tax=Nocardia sp. NPDC005746 TaxID=3157062 RepID=UPI0033C6C4BA
MTTPATDTTPTDTTRCDPHTSGGKGSRCWRHGQVAWFNTGKGFGFLTPDTGPAVFVDYQAIDVPGFKTLHAGQPVVFTAADTPRGPEATRVVPYTRTHTTAPTPSHRPHQARQHRSRCRHHMS